MRAHTQTDAAGRFSLAAASSSQGLIVVHEQGYSEVALADLEAAGTITLQPWGRVEGTLAVESQPLANEQIVIGHRVLRYDDAGRRFVFKSFFFETKTDSAGKFVFEKVPPGRWNVFRQMMLADTTFVSHDSSILVRAGAVTQVNVGGRGRPIIGKVMLTGSSGAIDGQQVSIHLRLKAADEPGPTPKRENFSSREAFITAMDSFFETSQTRRCFGDLCQSDGSFRLQDVPAGTYQLVIKFRGSKPDSVGLNASAIEPEIGSLTREIIVSEVTDGHGAEPLDLGLLELLTR